MYKKTIIRKFFVAYLKALIPSLTNRVYGGRIDSFNKKTTFPLLTVFSKDESIEEDFTSHTEREMDLLIGVFVRVNQTENSDFDELVENIMYEVEKAMSLLITAPSSYVPTTADSYRLFHDVLISDTKISNDNESGNDIGTALMRYKVTYQYESPVWPLTLEDFDVQGTINHIQIKNVGVPTND